MPPYIHKHTGKKTGIDVNVSHFNEAEGEHYFLHKGNNGAVKLARIYENIKHQQRVLARKLKENVQIVGKRSKSENQASEALRACSPHTG